MMEHFIPLNLQLPHDLKGVFYKNTMDTYEGYWTSTPVYSPCINVLKLNGFTKDMESIYRFASDSMTMFELSNKEMKCYDIELNILTYTKVDEHKDDVNTNLNRTRVFHLLDGCDVSIFLNNVETILKPGEWLEFDCTQSHSASVITTDKLVSSKALIYNFIPTEQHNPIELLKYSMIPYLYYTNHKDIYYEL